jgi:hypothetical protein
VRASRLSAACLAVVVAVSTLAGCAASAPTTTASSLPIDSFEPSSQPPASTTPSPADVDFRDWLLQPEDLVLPNAGYSEPQPATLNPDGRPGAETMIVSDDSTNAVGITILLLPDKESTQAGLQQAVSNIETVLPTGANSIQPVGDEAVSVSGTSRDGSQAATALMFRSARAIVRIDVYSRLENPAPLDFVIDVAQKQALAVRVGLVTAAAAR